MIVRDLRRLLQKEYSGKDHICVVLWSTQDIQERAYERGIYKISQRELNAMIDSLHKNHDTFSGIGWIDIDNLLDDYLERVLFEEDVEDYLLKGE